ncbi:MULTISPECIES: ATP-binding protein [Thalassospira]|uniref:ATP-binding protein n=1 Tax=Thalassospira aquimaris TaxID=3037796 RepID=A0ABT6G7Z9_9PROT|nr:MULTISPECIES: ATP-binding protein [Thalassospira]MDG4718180.1 ATP-binding protein [Thalassospira sp. FZY0004]
MQNTHDAAPNITKDQQLANSIRQSVNAENYVQTTLQTDERVIARVTDGIYRQPGSALRELISNAYDADATEVIIDTDAPRFQRITISDDGHGMSPEALAHLIHHIGGSAKRSQIGKELGVTSNSDPLRSPKGRRLIGKIGIGLFSVSQLSQSFQIITKIKDDPFRTIATVVLKQYSDSDTKPNENGENTFESGKVTIWRERANDTATHGTSIILTKIRKQAIDTLRSADIWNAVDQAEQSADEDSISVDAPKYHIGRVNFGQNENELVGTSDLSGEKKFDHLPWDQSDTPTEAFKKLVEAAWDEIGVTTPNPKLDRIFDYYLNMVWQLSLAVPLPYVDGHLFSLTKEETSGKYYSLSNQPKGHASELSEESTSPATQLGLTAHKESYGHFNVRIDDLSLARPIKYRDLPQTQNAITHPLIFIGKCDTYASPHPAEITGGPLAFEAYLFWTPKIAPVDHQGALIRIHGSSGTLFDSTFMKYQVSEQTRLRQITCEIFVHDGLDGALNIDRESFNNAHPHYVFITKWLHSAIRQLATAQKKYAAKLRETNRYSNREESITQIQQVAQKAWRREHDDMVSAPPTVALTDGDIFESKVRTDSFRFPKQEIIQPRPNKRTLKTAHQEKIEEEKIKAIIQLLASYGLLEQLPISKQKSLLREIHEIMIAAES